MTLVAGRVPSLHGLDSRTCRDDSSMPGILKSGLAHRPNKSVNPCMDKPAVHNQRHEDSKRLVRFCETEEKEELDRNSRDESEQDDQEVIMLGSNMYFINNPDPNSAVRKLFPNSKLTPINPFLSKQPKSFKTVKTNPITMKTFESNHNTINRNRSSKSDSEESGNLIIAKRKMDSNTLRRSMLKVPPESRPKQKLGKAVLPPTPLIERIKQLTCDSDKDFFDKNQEEERKCKEVSEGTVSSVESNILNNHEPNIRNNNNHYQNKVRDIPKKTKDGLNMMRCNEHLTHIKAQNMSNGIKQLSPTDEARRSFLSSLSQQNEAGDRNSIATISTTADTVYSLSDIEEALTEEEKEIRDAFAQEIKQDELELFVQQDAGRTERIRKRYNATPKPENPMPMLFSNNTYPQINSDLQHYPNNTMKKDKPKFGSTIEILQQLQQQIEIPYQLEGRRTACSNYSDSSIPISDRLFYDESSDGYEPLLPKLNALRSCSLDSKNYEEIDNFPSAFSVPRTKSQEHPRLTHFDSDTYFYPATSVRHPATFPGGNHLQEQNLYTSSPDLHRYHNTTLPDRFALYNNHTISGKQLHPVLQRQYCRYSGNEMPQRPVDEGKVLTPPIRMHTYMNVPANAPCYLSPPPYSKINRYSNSPPKQTEYQYGPPYNHSNIYQNVPPPVNHHLMTLRRLCTEKERGVPEGASSSQDSKESFTSNPKDYCSRTNITTIPKPSSLPHQYCVDV